MLTIKTNYNFRPLLSGYELTPDELREFDYIDNPLEEFNRFFRYRGQLYDCNEFVRIVKRSEYNGNFSHSVDENSPLLYWDGIQTDSFFSGIVIKFDENYENVRVGLALC